MKIVLEADFVLQTTNCII